MSTTSSPSSITATDAPTSRPWSKLPANACFTLSNRGSHVPWMSTMFQPPESGRSTVSPCCIMARMRRLWWGAVCLFALAACGGGGGGASGTTVDASKTGADAPPSVATLGDRACDTPASLGPTACYSLEVPERRDVAGSRTIKLWVAVATPADAPDRRDTDDLPSWGTRRRRVNAGDGPRHDVARRSPSCGVPRPAWHGPLRARPLVPGGRAPTRCIARVG